MELPTHTMTLGDYHQAREEQGYKPLPDQEAAQRVNTHNRRVLVEAGIDPDEAISASPSLQRIAAIALGDSGTIEQPTATVDRSGNVITLADQPDRVTANSR